MPEQEPQFNFGSAYEQGLQPMGSDIPSSAGFSAPELPPPASGEGGFTQVGSQTWLNTGELVSPNYKAGSVGWKLTKEGDFEANSGIFRGSLIAGSIDIPNTTTANSFHVDTTGNMWIGAVTFNIATNPFAVSNAGVMRAVSGTIGGCTLGETSISSATFVSGPLGSGWNISNTGIAEFQNITVRGMIRTSVFEKDTISAVNGMVLVSSADVLNADMTAADNSTITISGQTTFSVNEVIRIKDGTDDEWMLVTNAASAPIYTVTRDLAGSYDANANPIWKKGTAVVSMGVGTGTKTGFILFDSSSANSPYIDIYGRNSNTYSDYTLHGRFGWLKGIVDADVGLNNTDVWGLYTDNGYFKGTIYGSTITGGTIQTATSEKRVAIAGSDNTLRFYDAIGQVIGIGTDIGSAIRIDGNAETNSGIIMFSSVGGNGFYYQNSGNVASYGLKVELTGATNTGIGARIDNDGTGGAYGILLDTTNAAGAIYIGNTGTGDAIFINNSGNTNCLDIFDSGNSATIDITKSNTGNALEIVNSGSGNDISITHSSNSSYMLNLIHSATATWNYTVYCARASAGSTMFIDNDCNSANFTTGIEMDIRNAGAGLEYAFWFGGSEQVAAAIGGSQNYKIRVYCNGGTYYIPLYSA